MLRPLCIAFLLTIIGSACAPAAPPPGPPAGASPAAPAGPVLKAAKDAKLGSRLADANGKTVYLCTGDERNKSNCTSQSWPRLTGDKWTAGDGAVGELLKTAGLPDGSKQVTYNGWPLYYYSRDQSPGDSNGQSVEGVWFVVSPDGGPIQNNATVKSAKRDPGEVLSDASGRTLYAFTADKDGKPSCGKDCAQRWAPLLTVGDPKADAGVTAKLVASSKRDDGATQVTYNGLPLYYNVAIDEKPGDAKGQGRTAFGGDWFMVTTAGEMAKTAAGGAPAQPPSTPPAAPAPRGYGY